ncbi:uncharacterized protein LOC113859495 [Abrus precatorius]|uniref:Uncharacterized protein LOC113859495 n=1 Tax=Abrus precatorius TaxID=3816 RepID=A0A8B8KW04_ABRPR|nr:uncharacterized protein LOC113859495 [Abrus precatorius]
MKKLVPLIEECNAILQRKLPQKLKDPGLFSIRCSIGNCTIGKALCDLGASINLMPLAIMKKLGIEEVKPTGITLQLADRSYMYPYGVVEDLLVKVDKFIFLADFVILYMEVDVDIPLILGRPFLATGRALIDVQKGELMLRVQEEKVIFNVFKAIKHPSDDMSCMKIDVIDVVIPHSFKKNDESVVLESTLAAAKCSIHEEQDAEVKDCILQLDSLPCMNKEINQLKEELHHEEEKKDEPKVELKQLPSHLRYVFLEEGHNKPVIINRNLQKDQEEKLLRVLREHKSALGWQILDLKGIDPSFCMHIILFEENCKPVVQPLRRLNPTMKEVVR